MTFWTALLLAIVLLPLAAYAQASIGRFTAAPAAAALARGTLLAVGGALGYIATQVAETPVLALLYFAIGVGIVHVPAALILFMKRAGGAGKS
jgi:hypothetical protein